jgi:hypothetical protein
MEVIRPIKCRFLKEPHGVIVLEDVILHIQRRENIQSDIALKDWAL